MSVVLVMLVLLVTILVALAVAAFCEIAFSKRRYAAHPCSSMIAVTAPEVIEIVSSLRRNQPAGEVERIRNLAAQNARRAEALDSSAYSQAQIRCPLLCAGGDCCVSEVKPIHCWGRCADGSRDCGTHRSVVNDLQENIQSVGAGMSQGLQKAGLDGNLYELNSALATAMDTPDLASRWGRGDNIFADCRQF